MEQTSFINSIIPQVKKASFTELTNEQVEQIANYIWIFKSNNFKHHWEVNELISKSQIWDGFSELRSLNNHGPSGIVKGITPKFFAIICKVLEITGDDGEPLVDFEKY